MCEPKHQVCHPDQKTEPPKDLTPQYWYSPFCCKDFFLQIYVLFSVQFTGLKMTNIRYAYYLLVDDRADYICHRKWNDYICLHRGVTENVMIHTLVDKVLTDERVILSNPNYGRQSGEYESVKYYSLGRDKICTEVSCAEYCIMCSHTKVMMARWRALWSV